VSNDAVIDAGLGPGPSRLGDDASAMALRDAGYELTDFAGVFTASTRFEVRVGRSGSAIVRGPLSVTQLGALAITSGHASTFDPLDHANIDRSVLMLDRAMPIGEHPVLVSHHDDEVLALLVRFSRAIPSTWTPASLSEGAAAPGHTRSRTRFSFAITDREMLDEILARVLVAPSLAEINAMRALFGSAPLGPGDPLPGKRSPSGAHPVLDALREALGRGQPVVSNGILAMPVDVPVASFWGLDAHGGLAALACDLGRLRSVGQRSIDVSLVELHTSFRMTVAGMTLLDHADHVLVLAPPSVTVLDATMVLDGVESPIVMRTARRTDGAREHHLPLPEQGRMRAMLRLRLAAMDRPATRL